MIGNFARLLTGTPRVIEPELEHAQGTPPEGFTEKISDEGGDVYVAPMLEALRAALRRHWNPSTDVPEGGKLAEEKGQA